MKRPAMGGSVAPADVGAGGKLGASGAPSTRRNLLALHVLLVCLGAALLLAFQLNTPNDGTPTVGVVSSSSSSTHPSTIVSPSTGLSFRSVAFDPAAHAAGLLRWGIMFDAGSTGSRVHIYRFRLVAGSEPLLEDEIFVEVKPGLSAYTASGVGASTATRDVGAANGQLATGPDAAAASLKGLMDLCLEQIPSSAHKRTPISLRATAGLRLLGEDIAADILASIRVLFAKYPFPHRPEDVEVMGGSEEGVFAWITVNYLTRALRTVAEATEASKPAAAHPTTSAILDLGGASTQIVFEPSSTTLGKLPSALHSELYTLPYGARTYKLFETSYLGYGLMEARRRVKENMVSHPALQVHVPTAGADKSDALLHPCLSDAHEEDVPIGEPGVDVNTVAMRGVAQGHASCASLVRTLFPKAPAAPCASGHCSFGGHFALPLADHAALSTKDVAAAVSSLGRIYAFSYFYDRTLEIFELEEEEPGFHPHTGPDGTVLKLERIRHLADTVCSYSSLQNRVRSVEELEIEKAAEFEASIESKHRDRGCKVVQIKNAEGKVVRELKLQGDAPAKTGVSAAKDDADQSECMVEEKPSFSSHPPRISSPLASLVRSNPHLCLDLTYAHTLLHYGYSLPEATELHVMKRLQSKEVGWCLGAMLSQMAQQGW